MIRPSWSRLLNRQLYKMRLPVAGVLSLPLILGTLWYVWSAYAELDRYRRGVGAAQKVDAELFQLFLHDELDRDIKRMLLPGRPPESALPTFELSVAPADVETVMSKPSQGDGKGYVKAFVRRGGRAHPGKVRLRGKRHWHWLGHQKSLKIRLATGELIDGVRVFNLINDVTPFGLEEEVILDLARERGLLTPEYRPVWVRLNNAEMGVYRYEAQPAEGLLRRARRMPGSIYSGDAGSGKARPGVGRLFASRAEWRKAASKNQAAKEDYQELERLLTAVGGASHAEFRRFAQRELDLDKLAAFDALDVVFGGDQHDFLSNHKLYFDAHRGRFEPIAWNFRAFTNDPAFNLVENPLLLRLKAVPDYLWRRDRQVYELLLGPASVPAIRARVDERFEHLRPDLEADPYWDAYKLLARASRFHRFMVRPRRVSQWLMASRSELETYGRRSRFLVDALERSTLRIEGGRAGAGPFVIRASVGGYDAYRWRELDVAGDCDGRFELWADLDRDGAWDQQRDLPLVAGEFGGGHAVARLNQWLPGVTLHERPGARPKHGAVVTEREERDYLYFLDIGGCDATGVDVTLELESLVTGTASRRYLRLASAPLEAARLELLESSSDQVPTLVPGESSPHPWAFGPEPEPEVVTLGPGRVAIPETRVFEPHQRVEVPAGTRLELGPGASLIFEGSVAIRGTPSAPVELVAADPEVTFGGLLLRGPASAGSTIAHLRVQGGSHPTYLAVDAPSLINIYDTRDITLRNVEVRGARDAEDLVHATYVENLELFELALYDAPIDAIDVELSTAFIRGARVIGAGDECLDLMGSEVRIVDSLLYGCVNSAISAGEETVASVTGVAIIAVKTGVLAKNASTVRLSRSLIYRAERGLRTNRREVHYDGPSTIDAQDLYAVSCQELIKEAKRTRIKTTFLREGLPVGDEVGHLRRQVLGLDSWTDLDRAVGGLGGAAR